MKTLVLGDIHGLNIWEDIIEKNKPNRAIFLGDYVDSFDVLDKDMILNLSKIIEFKIRNPNTVKLLIGNHDIQYIFPGLICSGYRHSISYEIGGLLQSALYEGLLSIFHQEDGYLFSHAGVTKGWLQYNEHTIGKDVSNFNELNEFIYHKNAHIFFQCGPDRLGLNKVSGPLWVDKSVTQTSEGNIPGLIQIVGHTRVPDIEDKKHIIYCDTLENTKEDPKYLIINMPDGNTKKLH